MLVSLNFMQQENRAVAERQNFNRSCQRDPVDRTHESLVRFAVLALGDMSVLMIGLVE